MVKTPNGNLRLPKKTALVSRSAHDPRPADLADAPAALPPPLWPGLGKPFRLPQVRAMPGPPAPGFCLCHLLSSAEFLLSPLPPVAPAARTLGSRATRFIVTHTSIREQRKQAAPGAACRKKKTKEKRSATSQGPGRLQLVALARSRQASSLPAL